METDVVLETTPTHLIYGDEWEKKIWELTGQYRNIHHKLSLIAPALEALGAKVMVNPTTADTNSTSEGGKQGTVRSSLHLSFGTKRYGVRAEVSEYQRYSRSHLQGEPYNADFYRIPEVPELKLGNEICYHIAARWSNQKLEMSFDTVEEVQDFIIKLAGHVPVLEGYMAAYDDLRGKKTR